MLVDRREFLVRTAGVALVGAMASLTPARAKVGAEYKAIAFDAFPIFDPRPVAKLAEELFPGQATNLMAAWRSRQFEYQWLRALSNRYVDFWHATEDSLAFAARQVGVPITSQAHDSLMGAYSNLTVWPDVPDALTRLREAGIRLGLLSNMTKKMLGDGLTKANLVRLFDHVLSTDQIKTYKPAPEAYQMGVDSFGLRRQEVLFAAFAGWDAAGAKWFGYPTFWVNRLGSPAEELDAVADGVGPDLPSLATFALQSASSKA